MLPSSRGSLGPLLTYACTKPLGTLLAVQKINNKEQVSAQKASQMPSLITPVLFVF